MSLKGNGQAFAGRRSNRECGRKSLTCEGRGAASRSRSDSHIVGVSMTGVISSGRGRLPLIGGLTLLLHCQILRRRAEGKDMGIRKGDCAKQAGGYSDRSMG